MELSSDNLEELASVLNSDTCHQNDVFQEQPSFSGLDVDRVISEAQDSLLSTSFEAIRSLDGPCSFNDILDDICKMNNNIELQQAVVNTTTPQIPPIEMPAFYHMPDLEMNSENYTSECSFSNQNDFLQPLSQWSEYLSLPPSALNTIQDIPQLGPIPTTIPSPPPVPLETPKIKFPRDIQTAHPNSNAEIKKADSTTPTTVPLQFFNSFDFDNPTGVAINPSMQQNNTLNTNLQFAQIPENHINFMVIPEISVGTPHKQVVQQQPSFFDWARVVPRRAFMQPSEIVVLRPLRTRKVMSARPSFDLGSYFDTSTISIPMIKERPRSKVYRRKQKLYTIPGADNLIFEVQIDSSEEKGDTNNNNNINEEQLYPETELPELDEIFKRKRRTLHSRRNPQPQDNTKAPLTTQLVFEMQSKDIIDESPRLLDKELESPSDVDSDDAPLTIIKSMKCTNCRKLFKTCRSLTIHSKRCKVIRQSPKKEKSEEITNPPTTSGYNCYSKAKIDLKKQEQVVTRPLTRSQTRSALKRKRTEENYDEDGGGSQKYSK